MVQALGLLGTKGIKRLPIQDAVSGEIKKIISQSSINKFLLQVSCLSLFPCHTTHMPLMHAAFLARCLFGAQDINRQVDGPRALRRLLCSPLIARRASI